MPNPSRSDVIKPQVRGLSAYTLRHLEDAVKLDQNENPYELPTDFKREVAERVLRRPWARYPEFVPAAVIQTLAKFTGWPGEGILVGNGSNELIQASLTVTLGPGRKLAVPQPTFTLYKLMARSLQADVDEILLDAERLTFDVDKLLEASRTSEVVVVCTPNNPTGSLFDRDALVALLKNAKGLVLVDEAYHEFSGQTAFSLLPEHQNLAAIRAFPSKANFILIKTARPAHRLFDALYSRGVLVRDVSSYPLLDRCLRVSIGTPEENDRFLVALDQALEKENGST